MRGATPLIIGGSRGPKGPLVRAHTRPLWALCVRLMRGDYVVVPPNCVCVPTGLGVA